MHIRTDVILQKWNYIYNIYYHLYIIYKNILLYIIDIKYVIKYNSIL